MIGAGADPRTMLDAISEELQSRRSRIKKAWLEGMALNRSLHPVRSLEEISTIQNLTLVEYLSLLEARSIREWSQAHEPHLRILRGVRGCGFVLALGYLATGERAVFSELEDSPVRADDGFPEARVRWRFLSQREMEAQCADCLRVCATVGSRGFGAEPGWLEPLGAEAGSGHTHRAH
jgi:hypothetical protein